MGLLDEAIRDHLELKRRHGADPGEVERLEHEALGPARRGGAAGVAAPVEEPEQEESVYDVDADFDDEVPADERLEGRGGAAAAESDAPPPAAPEPAAPEREPDPPVSSVEQPTREFSIDELEEAEHKPGDAEPPGGEASGDADAHADDVLEETPEFLSETPEHDRLWFEQKPPRDFDF
jgi:hypothetical protein